MFAEIICRRECNSILRQAFSTRYKNQYFIRDIAKTVLLLVCIKFLYSGLANVRGIRRITRCIAIRGKNGQVRFGNNVRLNGRLSVIFDQETQGYLELGDNFTMDGDSVVSPRGGTIVFGSNCFIGPNCLLQSVNGAKISIGQDVMIAGGTGVIASNHNTGIPNIPMKMQGEKGYGITVEDDVWIGMNATVLDGVTIGRGAVIGAGAVVTKNVAPYSIMGGVPARVIRYRFENDSI